MLAGVGRVLAGVGGCGNLRIGWFNDSNDFFLLYSQHATQMSILHAPPQNKHGQTFVYAHTAKSNQCNYMYFDVGTCTDIKLIKGLN